MQEGDQKRPGDGQWKQREERQGGATGTLREQQPETEKPGGRMSWPYVPIGMMNHP